MARLKLKLWDSVVSDCGTCLELAPDNLKAFYYLSQAQLALKDYDDALENAKRAHEQCVLTGDKSLSAITAQVLKCKKERWDDLEKRRQREGSELETDIVLLMERERDEAVASCAGESDRREVTAEWESKIAQTRRVFEKARSAEDKRRNVPDWAIDDISFGIMVDPVIVILSNALFSSLGLGDC
ncbi:putative e3 ubiquitin-protein ligase chip protein [Phaeoacremonium minimum UCRPA7]|uniref:RING-type E3 ubiquitin transferase n=1 Tax=Phaeoacremonium minimum (strain UCR-PA7) TaxID=1286976 RepID=R8BBN4_PHAM7|nr:putative e3 ubiquitin-protein ligase chip protein [Phaeoacremonium minimum UCRPA7]EON96711.1 putative e3 ubiquitin-protein ligase chip protein [Phaeoacremonium minimum UCRPA7]